MVVHWAVNISLQIYPFLTSTKSEEFAIDKFNEYFDGDSTYDR